MDRAHQFVASAEEVGAKMASLSRAAQESTLALHSALPVQFIPHIARILAIVCVVLATLAYIALQGKVKRFGLSRLAHVLRFCYGCFLKPHQKDSNDQKAALESFYKTQASIYDSTRTALLKGREDMLGLVAAQIQWRVKTGAVPNKPVWVDVWFSPLDSREETRVLTVTLGRRRNGLQY